MVKKKEAANPAGISALSDSTSSSNPRTGKERFYYGWVIVVLCLLLVTNTYGIRFSFGVFFKSLEQDFDLTRALTSGIFSVYMLLGSVFALAGGWMADRYGPRIVLLIMSGLTFLGLVLSSQVTALWHLFLSYSLLVGIGTGPTYVIATSTATRWFQKQRGLALAIVTCGVGLGSILMAPVAAYLIENYQWRFSFIIIGLIALIILIPCSLFFKKPSGEVIVSSETKGTAAVSPNSSEVSKDTTEFSLSHALRSRNFWLIGSIWFCYSFCLFTIMTHIVPYATDSGITPLQAASILSVLGFASMPSRIVMGIVSDRFGRKPAGLIGAGLMVVAMVLLIQSPNPWLLYVFAVIFGVAYGGLTPSTTAIVGDTFGVRHIGTIIGTLEIGWMLGAAIGPALAGYIFDNTSNYFLAFLVGIVLSLIIVVLFLLIKTPAVKTKELSRR